MIETVSKVAAKGDRFGRYMVLGIYKDNERPYARVQCSCGSVPRFVRVDSLRNGVTQSCGCLHKERITKHGLWKAPLFKVWKATTHDALTKPVKR